MLPVTSRKRVCNSNSNQTAFAPLNQNACNESGAETKRLTKLGKKVAFKEPTFFSAENNCKEQVPASVNSGNNTTPMEIEHSGNRLRRTRSYADLTELLLLSSQKTQPEQIKQPKRKNIELSMPLGNDMQLFITLDSAQKNCRKVFNCLMASVMEQFRLKLNSGEIIIVSEAIKKPEAISKYLQPQQLMLSHINPCWLYAVEIAKTGFNYRDETYSFTITGNNHRVHSHERPCLSQALANLSTKKLFLTIHELRNLVLLLALQQYSEKYLFQWLKPTSLLQHKEINNSSANFFSWLINQTGIASKSGCLYLNDNSLQEKLPLDIMQHTNYTSCQITNQTREEFAQIKPGDFLELEYISLPCFLQDAQNELIACLCSGYENNGLRNPVFIVSSKNIATTAPLTLDEVYSNYTNYTFSYAELLGLYNFKNKVNIIEGSHYSGNTIYQKIR